MALEHCSENSKLNEVQQQASLVAWRTFQSDHEWVSTSTPEQRNEANQFLINGGVFNNVVIDYSSEPILAQAVQYRDYPTAQPPVPAQQSIFQNPSDSPQKLITGVSNQLNTTHGLSDFNDAGRLVSGMAKEGLEMVNNLANYLSEPYVVNNAIVSVGPVLDTALNYYANNDPKTVTQDAGVFSAAGLTHVDRTIDKFSYPMNQEKLGQQAVESMPWFLAGAAKPMTTVEKESLCELYGKKTLSEFTEVERQSLGLREMANYKTTFFNEYPELKDKTVVHHAVEQQVLKRFPGVFNADDIHCLDNLRGIPKDLNNKLHLSDIRRDLNEFYSKCPKPTKEEFLQKAREIDLKYGTKFTPPVQVENID